MSKRTVYKIQDFINTLDLSGVIISFVIIDSTTAITVSNTFNARVAMPIFIDDVEAIITAIDFDNNIITVSGVFASPSIFRLNPPFYFHGTPIATNNHISQANSNEKYPMIYLYEIFQEVDQDIFSSIDYISDIRLFFLDRSNFEDWNTQDHYTNVINGMNSLVDEFIKQLRDSSLFFSNEVTFTRTNHANFGNFVENQGHVSHFFDDYTSGVQLQFSLNVRKCCIK